MKNLVISILFLMSSNILKAQEFKFTGNEPGWLLEVFENSIELSRDYGSLSTTYLISKMKKDEGFWYFEGEVKLNSQIDKVKIIITKENCKDSMSGEIYPYSITIIRGFEILKGCGRKAKE